MSALERGAALAWAVLGLIGAVCVGIVVHDLLTDLGRDKGWLP